MTAPQAITSEIQRLEPSAIVELFELDATAIGGSVLRFHAGTNGLRQNIVWQGNTYTAFPLQATGFDFTGNGQLPRPKLVMSNATGALTLLVLLYDDLLGAKVTRRRTLAKYLDAVNFPARRNLLTRTEEFENPAWTLINTNVAANTATAPNGTTTADTLTVATSAAAYCYRISGVTSAGTFTYSMYVKPLSSTAFGLYFSSSVGGGVATYTLTGSGSASTTVGTATISSEANGWYRVSLNNVLTGAGNVGAFLSTPTAGNSWYIWGAQLETGSSATDYQAIGATWSQNPTADSTAEFPVDIFYIDRKASETRDLVEFELASSFDVAGVQLPRRQIIQNVCPWRYRGAECGYTGTNYFDANDASVGSLALDVCGKRLSSCKVRFGANNPLPFGSFPAAGLTR